MTPDQVNLLVAVTKAVEDLFADDRARRTALQALRNRVEREIEAEKAARALCREMLDEIHEKGDKLTASVNDLLARVGSNDLIPPYDFYDVPQADLDACDGVYVRGVVRTPGWTHEI